MPCTQPKTAQQMLDALIETDAYLNEQLALAHDNRTERLLDVVRAAILAACPGESED